MEACEVSGSLPKNAGCDVFLEFRLSLAANEGRKEGRNELLYVWIEE